MQKIEFSPPLPLPLKFLKFLAVSLYCILSKLSKYKIIRITKINLFTRFNHIYIKTNNPKHILYKNQSTEPIIKNNKYKFLHLKTNLYNFRYDSYLQSFFFLKIHSAHPQLSNRNKK